ncbi:hypothetical protein L0657_07420 [Dyadobacter sp. CY345]|uniref:hypothetical protein n=1 Tax=Dyadobacter sp. CY345 TaxID=2909335 RepID=UPI001F3513AD|nr:hypothetical protein [Dyadobacter sp. CY345]MCF2443781.1 hypothetical protein [Dyadobacter sp. CY345]
MDYSQYTRLIPSENSLNVILKNTHFKDDLLDEIKTVTVQIDFNHEAPIISVAFQEPFYDFEEILRKGDYSGDRGIWLKSDNLVIKLMLADSVFGDKISSRSFTFNAEESKKLKAVLHE